MTANTRATSRQAASLLVLSLLLLSLASCEGSIEPGGHDQRLVQIDLGKKTPDLPEPVDVGGTDLPSIGEPCAGGLNCAAGLICFGGNCARKCTEPKCNEKVAACAAGEVCVMASSFSGACVKSTVKTGEACGSGAPGAICAADSLCVNTGARYGTKCFKLCKACPTTTKCCLTDCGGSTPCCPLASGCFACIK